MFLSFLSLFFCSYQTSLKKYNFFSITSTFSFHPIFFFPTKHRISYPTLCSIPSYGPCLIKHGVLFPDCSCVSFRLSMFIFSVLTGTLHNMLSIILENNAKNRRSSSLLNVLVRNRLHHASQGIWAIYFMMNPYITQKGIHPPRLFEYVINIYTSNPLFLKFKKKKKKCENNTAYEFAYYK